MRSATTTKVRQAPPKTRRGVSAFPPKIQSHRPGLTGHPQKMTEKKKEIKNDPRTLGHRAILVPQIEFGAV